MRAIRRGNLHLLVRREQRSPPQRHDHDQRGCIQRIAGLRLHLRPQHALGVDRSERRFGQHDAVDDGQLLLDRLEQRDMACGDVRKQRLGERNGDLHGCGEHGFSALGEPDDRRPNAARVPGGGDDRHAGTRGRLDHAGEHGLRHDRRRQGECDENRDRDQRGWGSLTVSSVALGGANVGDFALGGTCTLGATLSAGQSCTIGVTFKPTQVGPSSASISAVTSARSGNISVVGTGGKKGGRR